MAAIGFIGLGNMGGPDGGQSHQGRTQASCLRPVASSRRESRRARARRRQPSASDAAKGAEAVITMLPAGQHVREHLSRPGRADRLRLAGRAPDRLLHHRRGDGARGERALRKPRGSTCSTRRSRAASAARRPQRSPSWRAEAQPRSRALSRSLPAWARPWCMLAARATAKPPKSATT